MKKKSKKDTKSSLLSYRSAKSQLTKAPLSQTSVSSLQPTPIKKKIQSKIEFQPSKGKSKILSPYRRIGELTSSYATPYLYTSSDKLLLLMPINSYFTTYQVQHLRMLNSLDVGLPQFKRHAQNVIYKISQFKDFTVCQKQNLFVLYKKSEAQFILYVSQLYENEQAKILESITCGKTIISLLDNASIVMWEISVDTQGDVSNHQGKKKLPDGIFELLITFTPTHLFHPSTYLNKILLYDQSQEIVLFNINSRKIIYDFKSFRSMMDQQNLHFNGIICQSPIPDIHAFAMKQGKVILWNLKSDQQILRFSILQGQITWISFSTDNHLGLKDISLIAIGLSNTCKVLFYDLNLQTKHCMIDLSEYNILCKFSSQFQKFSLQNCKIDYCQFIPHQSSIIITSAELNFIGIFVFDQENIYAPRLLKHRRGNIIPPKTVRFYQGSVNKGLGQEAHHIISSSQIQLRDHALLNDSQTCQFSYKKTPTSFNLAKIPPIKSSFIGFDFSYFRERDWANLLTYHSNSQNAYLWSVENHVISSTPIQFNKTILIGDQVFYAKKYKKLNETKQVSKNRELIMEKDDFITSVCVTNCGNFGVLGYNSGKIIKFNMQSGIIKYKVTPINRQSSVNGIEIDCVNRNMCCINGDGSFNCYDFYNGPYHCLFTQFPSTISEKTDKKLPLEILKLCDMNGFAAMSDSRGCAFIYDLKTFLLARILKHSQSQIAQISDLAFVLPKGRQLITTTFHGSFYIWDILYGTLLETIIFDLPVIGIDVSRSGSFITTIHKGSKQIQIWSNQQKFQNISDSSNSSQAVRINLSYQKQSGLGLKVKKIQIPKMKNQKTMDERLSLKYQQNQSVSSVPQNKWRNLLYLQQIKERNKAKLPKQTVQQMPFFLFDIDQIIKQQKQRIGQWDDDDDNDLFNKFGVQERGLYDQQDISLKHFMKNRQENYEAKLVKFIDTLKEMQNTKIQDQNQVLMRNLFIIFQDMSPSAIQYQIRTLKISSSVHVMNDDGDMISSAEIIERLQILFRMLSIAFDKNYHIDTAQSILNTILRAYNEEVIKLGQRNQQLLFGVIQLQKKSRKKLERSCLQCQSILDNFIAAE